VTIAEPPEDDQYAPGVPLAILAQTAPSGSTLDADLVDACGAEPAALCRWVFDTTGNRTVATLADWFVDRPMRVVIIVVVAYVLTRLLRRAVGHLNERLTEGATRGALEQMRRGKAGRLLVDPSFEARSKARTNTITGVLSSAGGIAIWVIAGLMILGEVGISLAPLIAGAGIAGLAIGFGAQSLVRDVLAGFFVLVEDQYGVGDVVDVGEVSGTVERVSLRTTVLRDVHGAVWHVPNGEISRVANKSQLWSRAVVDVEVAYDTDLRLAQGVIQRVADDLWRDPEFIDGDIIEAPEVWGIEALGADGITIRLVVKTDPAEQWVVARELRLRIKEAFDAAGIEIPFPQRTIWLNQDPRSDSMPDPAGIAVAPPRRNQRADGVPPPDVAR
jgi:small conductance mechanosensitive channel